MIMKFHQKQRLIQRSLPLDVSGRILLRRHIVPSPSNSAFRGWRETQDLSTPIFSRTQHAILKLKEGQISIFRTDGPGWSPNEPMALVQVKIPSIPDGKYLIKNRGRNIYWCTGYDPITTVYYFRSTMEDAKKETYMQVNDILQLF